MDRRGTHIYTDREQEFFLTTFFYPSFFLLFYILASGFMQPFKCRLRLRVNLHAQTTMPTALFFLFLSYFNGFILAVAAGTTTNSLRLELLRHPPPPSSADRLDYLRELVRSDLLRQHMITRRIRGRHHPCGSCGGNYGVPENGSSTWMLAPAPATAPEAESFEMPLSSGAYTGTGQYFVRFLLGTPAQKFVLVADTGSDLTWVKCHLHSHDAQKAYGGRGAGNGRVFSPEKSSSYVTIRCSSEMCKTSLPFSLTTCPTPASPCAYDYGYSDGSTAQGVFANESATITLSDGQRAKLRGLVVGCTSSSAGSSFKASDGVLGLGYSDVSFATRATRSFGGRFSYCLVDHLSPRNATSYLTFGHNPALCPPAAPPPHVAKFVLDPRLEPFYGVGIDGISVDGKALEIPSHVWDVAEGGGAILDSGTSLTMLAEPAYKAVVAALSRRLAGLPRVDVDPFEYCYNWTGKSAEVPKMVVHLAGPARLEPPTKSYVINVAAGVKCIGITSAPWPGVSTIGNILQQEHLWEFDLKNRRLRFRRSKCSTH